MNRDDHAREIEALIPWYANGTLDDVGRRRLEEHLPGCASCPQLLERARLFRQESSAHPELVDWEHPQARLVAELVRSPESLHEETRARIASHFRACEPCRKAAQAFGEYTAGASRVLEPGLREPVRAPSEDASEGPGRPPESPHRRGPGQAPAGPGLWETLKRTILGPVPALVYLVLILLVGWQAIRSVVSPGPEAPPAPAIPSALPRAAVLPEPVPILGEITYREPAAGGELPAPERIPIPIGPAGSVQLALRTDLEEEDLENPDLRYEVRLLRDGEMLWTETVEAGDFTRLGVLSLLMPAEPLRAGAILTVEVIYRGEGHPLDGATLFRRRIQAALEGDPR